jgi:putative alpha-1,2-mannosidase
MMETNASGTYYYSGFDNSVHQGDYAYHAYSIWDTFRSEWAFINLFAPERVNGMIIAMLQMYEQGGRLPMWWNIVETNIMIGTHSSSLIAESLAKGFNDFDLELIWEAIYKDAMVPPDNDLTTVYYDREEGTACEARAGLTRELELGYVAAILTSEAGSRTLEYAYDDFTVGVVAELTGHADQAKFFLIVQRIIAIFSTKKQCLWKLVTKMVAGVPIQVHGLKRPTGCTLSMCSMTSQV